VRVAKNFSGSADGVYSHGKEPGHIYIEESEEGLGTLMTKWSPVEGKKKK
jgi:hypothetical protein